MQVFVVGDIVVNLRYGSGSNRTHDFGIVTKITPSGKLRIQGIQSQIQNRVDIPTSPTIQLAAESKTTVIPSNGHEHTGKTYLVNAQGYAKREGWNSVHFELYDPNTQYDNITDFLC